MTPLPSLGQIAPTAALDAAQRLGSSTPAVLLAVAAVGLGVAAWSLWKDNSRLHEARLADAERYARALSALHTAHAAAIAVVQAERIEEIERIVRGCDTLADALRAVEALRDSYAPRPAPRGGR